jgi:hypothetical protein
MLARSYSSQQHDGSGKSAFLKYWKDPKLGTQVEGKNLNILLMTLVHGINQSSTALLEASLHIPNYLRQTHPIVPPGVVDGPRELVYRFRLCPTINSRIPLLMKSEDPM